MAIRILKFTFFKALICLMFGCNLNAQELNGLVYNFNEPISQIGSELRASQAPECYANLLSISNIMSNYFVKKDVPKSLIDFLVDKKLVSAPANTEELKREVFIVARYIHSVNYDSYLLMAVEDHVDIEEDDTKDLYLINVRRDILISVCYLAFHLNGIGLTMQRYSFYQGDDTFESIFETIESDVEFIQEEDKVKMKHDEINKVIIVVDRDTGKIYQK